LRARIAEGKFREDLYHRLDGLVLTIPPLRERVEDLPALIAMELKNAAEAAGRRITSIHPAAMEMLLRYPWPGNLRELYHAMRGVALFCEGKVVLPEHVHLHGDTGAAPSESSDADPSLAAAVARHVQRVYEQNGCNQRQAARLLGISRGALARHLGKAAG
jgi:DNA-binding NtrC family response regulator